MARGKKKATNTNKKETLFNLIEYNPDIMEDEKKKPNLQLDKFVGICVDKNDNWELMKVKQTIVTEDNIKSTTNVYGDKYKIGDTYQEWISFDKYPNSFESAVELYSKIDFLDKVGELEYCTDITELTKIRQEFNDRIKEFLNTITLPKIIKEMSVAFSTFEKLQCEIDELGKLKDKAINDCNNIINVVSEKYASMVAKGIVVQNQVKHKTAVED